MNESAASSEINIPLSRPTHSRVIPQYTFVESRVEEWLIRIASAFAWNRVKRVSLNHHDPLVNLSHKRSTLSRRTSRTGFEIGAKETDVSSVFSQEKDFFNAKKYSNGFYANF